MNVAAQLYTVREFTQTPQGIAETLRKVSQIGYRTVHCSKMGPIDPYQLRDLLQENNLSCVVTHIDPERLLTEVDRVIEEHRIYHCDSVRHEHHARALPRLLRRVNGKGVRDFTPAVERILDSGLTFHYHNHDVEFIRYQKRSLLEHLPGRNAAGEPAGLLLLGTGGRRRSDCAFETLPGARAACTPKGHGLPCRGKANG